MEFNMLRPTIQHGTVDLQPRGSGGGGRLAPPTEPTESRERPPQHPKSQTIQYSPFPDSDMSVVSCGILMKLGRKIRHVTGHC